MMVRPVQPVAVPGKRRKFLDNQKESQDRDIAEK
jgi:hypothetical protein